MTLRRGRRRVLPPPDAAGWARPPEILRLAGACVSSGQPDLFYDDDYSDPAIAICHTCPVRDACLEYAIAHEEHGVWGGMTPQGRADLRGTPHFVSVEARRLADRIRTDVVRGVSLATVASREGISMRTVERWLSEQGLAA